MANGNVPTVSMSFEEKLQEKIKNEIGELLSTEDLKKILEVGINKIFFTVPNNNYGTNITLAEKIVKDHFEKHVREFMQDYFAKPENQELLTKTLKENLTAEKLITAFIQNLTNRIEQSTDMFIMNLTGNLIGSISNKLNNTGRF